MFCFRLALGSRFQSGVQAKTKVIAWLAADISRLGESGFVIMCPKP